MIYEFIHSSGISAYNGGPTGLRFQQSETHQLRDRSVIAIVARMNGWQYGHERGPVFPYQSLVVRVVNKIYAQAICHLLDVSVVVFVVNSPYYPQRAIRTIEYSETFDQVVDPLMRHNAAHIKNLILSPSRAIGLKAFGVYASFYQNRFLFKLGRQKIEAEFGISDGILISFKHGQPVVKRQASASAIIRDKRPLAAAGCHQACHVRNERVYVVDVDDIRIQNRPEVTEAQRIDFVPMNEMFDGINFDLEIPFPRRLSFRGETHQRRIYKLRHPRSKFRRVALAPTDY